MPRIIEKVGDITRCRDEEDKPLLSKRALNHWRFIDNLYDAFKDPRGKYRPRTWAQLLVPTQAQKEEKGTEARFPKSSLSRTLKELIAGGFMAVEIKINTDGKRETVYKILQEWTPECRARVVVAKLVSPDGSQKELGEYHGKIYKRRGKMRVRLAESEKRLLEDDIRKAKGVEK